MADAIDIDEIILDAEVMEVDVKNAPVQQAPVQQAPVATSKPSPPAQISDNGDSADAKPKIDAADQKLSSIPGISVVSFGDKVSRFPIEKIKFSQSKKSLISIISLHPIVLKTHYDETMKSFLCFEGACCDTVGFPNVRYIFPIMHYLTDDRGRVPSGSQEVELKLLSVGDQAYENLIDIHTSLQTQGHKLTDVDLIVTCSDEGYQKVIFTQMGAAQWKRFDAPTMRALLKKWKDNKDTSYRVVAKSVTPEVFARNMNLSFSPGLDASNLDLDDILSD